MWPTAGESPQNNLLNFLCEKGGPRAIFQGDKNSCLCPWDPEILAMPLKQSMKDGELKKYGHAILLQAHSIPNVLVSVQNIAVNADESGETEPKQ